MKKEINPFDILQRMNQMDIENSTRLLPMSTSFIEGKKCSQGALITMGVEEAMLLDLMNNTRFAALFMIDKETYFRLSNEEKPEKSGIDFITEERKRQVEEEGFTPENDRKYKNGELALAAAAYAVAEDARTSYKDNTAPSWWPWDDKWWKPTPDNRIKELAKAGALIAAAIDRIQAEEKEARRV